MIEAGVMCLLFGIVMRYSSRSRSRSTERKAELILRATHVKELKGLGDLLGEKPMSRIVVVFGYVKSTSSVAVGDSCSGALGVFLEEKATICYTGRNSDGYKQEFHKIAVNCKKVPWYLYDGTARVTVTNIQFAKGFKGILKKYSFTRPVAKHIERLFCLKKVQDPEILQHNCCEQVLEIGTPLTIVGKAERDKDGTPAIREAYEVFRGLVNVDEMVSSLESDSKYYAKFSMFVIAIGVAIVAVSIRQSS